MNEQKTRRMLQPAKDVLRDQLALAATEIIRLRGVIGELQADLLNELSRSWWRRMFRRGA